MEEEVKTIHGNKITGTYGKQIIHPNQSDPRMPKIKNILYLLGYLTEKYYCDEFEFNRGNMMVLDHTTLDAIVLFQHDYNIELATYIDLATYDALEKAMIAYKENSPIFASGRVMTTRIRMEMFKNYIEEAKEDARNNLIYESEKSIYYRAFDILDTQEYIAKENKEKIANKTEESNQETKINEYDKAIDDICKLINVYDNSTWYFGDGDAESHNKALYEDAKQLIDRIRDVIRPFNSRIIEINELVKECEALDAREKELSSSISKLMAEYNEIMPKHKEISDKVNYLLHGDLVNPHMDGEDPDEV